MTMTLTPVTAGVSRVATRRGPPRTVGSDKTTCVQRGTRARHLRVPADSGHRRHLDLGAQKCFMEAEISRVDRRRCERVRTGEVPWARPGARHTRDFQDAVA